MAASIGFLGVVLAGADDHVELLAYGHVDHRRGGGGIVGEVATAYGARPEGSASKLSTFRDGWRILKVMLNLFRTERPWFFFGSAGALLVVAALLLSIPLVMTYIDTGLVPRFPTAILATGLMVLAAMSFFAGLMLDTVTRGRRELKMLAYLREKAPG